MPAFSTSETPNGDRPRTGPREFRVRTADFVEIAGRIYDGGKKRLIIYCHPLLGNATREVDVLSNTFGDDYDVLTFDFRGHRSSSGECTSGGNEILDLRAVIAYARSIGYGEVLVFGAGMGGTVGARAAAIFGNVDGLVVLSPSGFSPEVSPLPVRVITDVTTGTMFGKIPIRILTQTRLGQPYAAGYPVDAVPSPSSVPALIIQSEDDHFVRSDRIHEIFAGVLEPTQMLIVPGTRHAGDLLNADVLEIIREFVGEHIGAERDRRPAPPGRQLEKTKIDISGDLPVPEDILKNELVKTTAASRRDSSRSVDLGLQLKRLLDLRGYSMAVVSRNDSSLVVESPKIESVQMRGNRWMSDQYIRSVLSLDGDFYNSYELDSSMRKLALEPGVNTVKSRVVQRNDGNVDIQLEIVEQKPYRLLLATKFTDTDKYFGLGLSWNEFNPAAFNSEGRVLFGLEGHDLLGEVRLGKAVFRNTLKFGVSLFDVVKSRDDLDYIFTRQEVQETGGELKVDYDITSYSTVAVSAFEKRYGEPKIRQLFPVESGTADGVGFKFYLTGKLPLQGIPRFRWEHTFYYQNCGIFDYGDFGFETYQLNLSGESTVTDFVKTRTTVHSGWIKGPSPPQEQFSLGGMTTLPGYADDSFVNTRMFLAGQKVYFSARSWAGETSKWAPLRLILAFHAGTVWGDQEELHPDQLRMDAGVELDYMETLRAGVVWPVGPFRGDSPRVYVGWGVHVF